MVRKTKKKGKQLVTKQYLNAKLNKAIETKYYYTLGASSPDTGGSLVTVSNGIAQGDAYNERLGDRITPIHCHIKGTVTLADTTNWVRIVLIRWKQDYGDLTDANQIFEATGATTSPYSLFVKEPDNRARFDVLADRLFNLHSNEPQKAFDIRVSSRKLHSRPVSFTAGGSGGNGQLVMVTISDSAAVAHPSISYYLMLKYKDA
ncbi:hypothetical protein [Ctenophore-associated circular virus 4]|uniref:hypothetical protein n=1 Tax=Ctenophore-associated circular virus 4 TaxID=1778561 RepID=UPI000764CF0F|nr:hypothetical protein [Ctenophore-associated circular virus 4]ALY05863.1 hypothetical protein [Ctenophore-associated circular virus 4]